LYATREAVPSFTTRRRRRWLPWTIGILVFLIVAAPLAISVKVGWSLTHKERKAITTTPASVGLAFAKIEFPSRIDHLTMRGWYMAAPTASTKAVIIAHGYGGNRLEEGAGALGTAKFLTEQGYNVLMFDFRASGESDGDTITVGPMEKRDLAGAVDYVRGQGNQKVGLLGYSMGAGTALQTAAEVPEVDAVVADSSMRDFKAYLQENMTVWTHLPDFPFTSIILAVMPTMIGANMADLSPVSVAPQLAKKPMLLFAGDKDEDIPMKNSQMILEAYQKSGGSMGKLVVIPGAGHVKANIVDQARYRQELSAFFAQSLK
jgi:dipeptidyl aminopeptidase/acylaminoacyl peptidase